MTQALKRDEYGLSSCEVRADNGWQYLLTEVPQEMIFAREDDVVVLANTFDLTFVRWEEAPSLVFRVTPAVDPMRAFAPPPARAEDFVASGYRHLKILSSAVFARGESSAVDDIVLGAFVPQARSWEAIPASYSADDPLIEICSIHGKRFGRQTLEGADAARAAAREKTETEKASRAIYETTRAAVESEGSRSAAERAEQQRQEKYNAWLGALPANLQPDALVLDLTEFVPRIGRVMYESVHCSGADQYFFDRGPNELPTHGTIMFGAKPIFGNRDQEREWETLGSWDAFTFFTDGRAGQALERFALYEGPLVPVGTRVKRPASSDVRYAPTTESIAVVGLDIIGTETDENVDDAFTIEHALEFLEARAPVRAVKGQIAELESHGDHDNEDDDGMRQSHHVSLSLREDYPHYYSGGQIIGDLSGIYSDGDWLREHRRLLANENNRRQIENAKWRHRRQFFLLFLQALGANCEAAESNYGRNGLYCEIALTEGDLDRLVVKLRNARCQVIVHRYPNEPRPGFLSNHSASTERLDDLFARWKKSDGSAVLFKPMIADLLTTLDGVSFVVSGILPRGTVGLLIGPTKLGKSVLGYNLAACVAAGVPFVGLEVDKGVAVLLYGEDTQDIVEDRRKAALDLTAQAGTNLLPIDARQFGFSLKGALEELAPLKNLKLLIVDTARAFVPNTNDGGAVGEFMNLLSAFAASTGCAVLVVHHTSKELTAFKAKTAKIVMEKAKGSGDFVTAARVILTLHLDSNSKDEAVALREGIRCLTLAQDNIPPHVAKLQGSMGFKLDRSTGLAVLCKAPNIGVAPLESRIEIEASGTAAVGKGVGIDDDARLAGPVIVQIERQSGRRLAFAGGKALFRLKSQNDLPGWSRARCERAHRRAVVLGLCKVS